MASQASVNIICVSSSAQSDSSAHGQVVISGSYGGEYNAFHAGKWGLRGLVLNDAGVGKGEAGIRGLPYLDAIGLAAATADARTCHIADPEHMLAHGVISFVNKSAEKLGCRPGDSVRACATRMFDAAIAEGTLAPIAGGKRFTLRENPGERTVIGIDAAPMLEAGDAGKIAVTGSHAALFRGHPDDVIKPDVYAVFFNDAGIGLDDAGVTRLPTLDLRNIVAGAVDCNSAPIGNCRAIYADGVLSRVNQTASRRGAKPGMPLRQFIDILIAARDQL
ncbi:MAG TPA: hypothetical protein VG894_12240 [Bauldia sp.]|nr:hypothetical protein [Bauldia sp.]